MPTINGFNNEVLSANVTFNGGTASIGTDATSGAINIGTGAAARTTTIGNVTGATAVNINTGTGGSAITTTNGTFAVATGTGAMNLGTDAVAKTITIGNGTGATSVVVDCGTGALNIGANAVAKTTTLGATTGASVLALKYGTGDFTLASATGTVMSALDTGEITKPLQPAFAAYKSAASLNVTGAGTTYTIIFNTEDFDQSADYNNATGVFTAPVTGKYYFEMQANIYGSTATDFCGIELKTTDITYTRRYDRSAQATAFNPMYSIITNMDAGDTCYVTITVSGDAGDTTDLNGTRQTSFYGYLIC